MKWVSEEQEIAAENAARETDGQRRFQALVSRREVLERRADRAREMIERLKRQRSTLPPPGEGGFLAWIDRQWVEESLAEEKARLSDLSKRALSARAEEEEALRRWKARREG